MSKRISYMTYKGGISIFGVIASSNFSQVEALSQIPI